MCSRHMESIELDHVYKVHYLTANDTQWDHKDWSQNVWLKSAQLTIEDGNAAILSWKFKNSF